MLKIILINNKGNIKSEFQWCIQTIKSQITKNKIKKKELGN